MLILLAICVYFHTSLFLCIFFKLTRTYYTHAQVGIESEASYIKESLHMGIHWVVPNKQNLR